MSILKALHHKRALVIVGIVFFITGSVMGVLAFSTKSLPETFISSRDNAAAISQEIVTLTNQTEKALEDANKLDIQGKGKDALGLINQARKKNNTAYEKAFELSGQLKNLAESLQNISGESQRIAYEAVATELALVSEFIVYTKNVNTFLDELSSTISQNTQANRQAVQSALQEANGGVKKINALNNQFLQKMGEFDALVR